MKENGGEFRGMFLQLGNNMWSDVPVKDWALTKKENLADVSSLDVLRFDEAVWRRLTDRMVARGFLIRKCLSMRALGARKSSLSSCSIG